MKELRAVLTRSVKAARGTANRHCYRRISSFFEIQKIDFCMLHAETRINTVLTVYSLPCTIIIWITSHSNLIRDSQFYSINNPIQVTVGRIRFCAGKRNRYLTVHPLI